MKKALINMALLLSLLMMIGLFSCANANKTAEFAPEKDIDNVNAVSADVPGVTADTTNTIDAEPIQP